MVLTDRQQNTYNAFYAFHVKEPKQLVYADLPVSRKVDATRIKSVLVIIDGYYRYKTMQLLRARTARL